MATTTQNTDYTLAGIAKHFDANVASGPSVSQGPWQPESELDELHVELGAVNGVVNEVISSTVSRVKGWFFKSRIPAAHQREAKELQFKFDTVCDTLEERFEEERDAEGKVKVRKPRRDNADWWVAYSVMARGKFQSPSNTVGMRRTIHKWIYEHMEADKVRKLDISRVVHRATEWVYHATEGELAAVKDRNTVAMVEREKAFETPWWSYWWGVSRRSVGSD